MMMVAHTEAEAEALVKDYAADELKNGYDVCAFECKHIDSVDDKWRRALPYGANRKKNCLWWIKKMVGLVK